MITQEQVDTKYKHVKLYFTHYYKYTFTYEGKLDSGEKIIVTYGGCSDDIYRHEVSNDYEYFSDCNEWNSVAIFKGSELIFDYCSDY